MAEILNIKLKNSCMQQWSPLVLQRISRCLESINWDSLAFLFCQKKHSYLEQKKVQVDEEGAKQFVLTMQ